MAEKDNTTLTVRCLCGASTFSCDAPASKLPLKAAFCHCTSCRHAHGTLTFSAAPWPSKLPSDLTSLTKYPFSPGSDFYFCSTCGTTIFWHDTSEEYPEIAVGALENAKDLLKFTKHIYIGDTKDGGISEWVTHVQGVELERREENEGMLPLGWRKKSDGAESEAGETLKAWCLCKGVQFEVTKPNKDSANPDISHQEGRGRGTWWLDPNNQSRYKGGICVCDSCRLGGGQDLIPWAFIPDVNLQLPDGSPLNLPAPFGTLKVYKSRKDVTRLFCGTCGAMAFYCNDVRPRLIDVGVGLLDAEEGARAEKWLWWDTRGPGKHEDGFRRGLLAKDLYNGMCAWNEKHGIKF